MKDFKKELQEKMQTELPEKLKKENIIEKLQKENTPKSEIAECPKMKTNTKIWATLVASFAVIFMVCAVFYNAPTSQTKKETDSTTIAQSQNYDKVFNTLKKIKENGYYNINSPENMLDDNICGGMGSENSGDYESGSENHNFGTTNIQEKDVDESNTILTDGKYIYAVNTGKITFNIIKSDNGKMEILSTISIKEKDDDILTNASMYLYKNYVAIIYEQYFEAEIYKEVKTFVKVFDIKDKKTPKMVKIYGQEGIEIGTRRINNKIYLITQRGINLDSLEKNKNFIPEICNNGLEKPINPNNIFINENSKTPQYTIIGVIDMESENDFNTKAILDDCSYIYSSKNNIYTITLPYFYFGESETKIHKYEITKDGVKDIAACKISGTPHNQFSFSEKDGYLRVATSVPENPPIKAESDETGMDLAPIPNFSGSNVYILNEKLQVVSSLTDIAKGEEIKAARFIDNMLYLVTFRQTDPLFAIDLSESEKPVIMGKIKLPGFSYYLHPISKTLLAGIGSDGTEDGVNGNLKVSLFNVSNPQAPKEISKVLVLNENNKDFSAFSMLVYEHKLFISLPDNEFAIPVEISGNSKYEYYYIRYGIKDNKIYEIARYFNDDFAQIMGGTFIDDTFYSMGLEKTGLNQIITAYDMTTNNSVSEIEF